jgi:hypothetical protein
LLPLEPNHSSQPFTQQQPFSYGQATGNALNAAALGFDLGGGGRPAGSEYTRPTQLPPGSQVQPVQGGAASYQQYLQRMYG